MGALRKYLRLRYLKKDFKEAVAALGGALYLEIREGKKLFFSLDETPSIYDAEQRCQETLFLNKRKVGVLICTERLEPGHQPRTPDLATRTRFLAKLLQRIISVEHAKRAVSEEALEQYRLLFHLHRAAVTLNESLHAGDIAARLLEEFQQSEHSVPVGGLFWQKQNDFELLGSFGIYREDLIKLKKSQIFKEIVNQESGEVVNQLDEDQRWHKEVRKIDALLLVPLVIQDRTHGLLVLASMYGKRTFNSNDLHQATTLAAIAAASLRNADLFQETLEAKSDHENILRSLNSGVITIDNHGTVLKVNQAALNILDVSAAKVLHHTLKDLFIRRYGWVALLPEEINQAGDVIHITDRKVMVVGGREVAVNLSVNPLTGADGRQQGVVFVIEDITREKRIKGAMGRYLPDQVVDTLLQDDTSILGGKEQLVTILFSDIRGFTELSEKTSAQDTVTMLNDYFRVMVDVLFEHQGTLDKFLGDALMALFGAPIASGNDADRAVSAAVAMLTALHGLNVKRRTRRLFPIKVGVGLNTGMVIAGNIGSDKRMDYTVIGDPVNLAARLESANKIYGTKLLISEKTKNELKEPRLLREIDWVRVKGKQQPIRIYEVMDHYLDTEFPALERAIEHFSYGVQCYRQRQWQEAGKAFAEVIRIKPMDKPALIYLQRCLEYGERAPDPLWDGVVTLGEK
ncbi:adenylate/guanylate cyclase domain-containing protein [Magnetococcales bacterium HHB-1]